MVFVSKYFFQVPVLLILLSLLITDEKSLPTNGFWAMEGTLVTHYFEDKTDSLSGPELFELQDENGLPIWFGRHIFKDVCISGKCIATSIPFLQHFGHFLRTFF